MKPRIALPVFVVLLLTTFTLLVSADSSAPLINGIVLVQDGSNPIIKIKGNNFGREAAAVQVMVNENGALASVLKVKPKKLLVQLPATRACAGKVTVRVLVNKMASNGVVFDLSPGAPILERIDRNRAATGSLIEISGKNFACQPQENRVSFDGVETSALAVNGDSLTVRVPSTVTVGRVEVRVAVEGDVSSPLRLTIEPSSSTGGGESFVNETGIPGGAGFAPLFSIKDNLNQGGDFWSASFFGTHQAIINAPWVTLDGKQQVALLTLNFGRSNSLVGNNTGMWEKFIYLRINYPLYPEKAYDPLHNPFWWGSSAICTEHFPRGNVYFNSLAQATGGVDAFTLPTSIPGRTKLNITMKIVAPDLFNYEFYGINYANAGDGVVSMPKVATVTIELPEIEARFPVAKYQRGTVTITDESGNNGTKVTSSVTFTSDVLTVTGQTQL
ncbi:MAG: IPT/TIG domain-containing protein [Acidobacteriota bacterium]